MDTNLVWMLDVLSLRYVNGITESFIKTWVTFSHTVDGSWGEWGMWKSGVCSVTCGIGTRTITRTRVCDNTGGKDCQGDANEEKQQSCRLPDCPGILLIKIN